MTLRHCILLLASLLALIAPARAVPELQLDILGGSYDTSTESIVANGSVFTLRTLLKGSANLPSTYYISAALLPAPSGSGELPNAGSFKVDGVVYSTSTLDYGVPPLDVVDGLWGNLGAHGVYPTYFKELDFTFSADQTVAAYNTQTQASATGALYYRDFLFDVSGLKAGYYLHFDLYDERVKKGRWVLDDFAPFSHDAQSRPAVPEGASTVALLGLALLGKLAFDRRRASGAPISRR